MTGPQPPTTPIFPPAGPIDPQREMPLFEDVALPTLANGVQRSPTLTDEEADDAR